MQTKLILLGSGGVGKTTLVAQYVHGELSEDESDIEGIFLPKYDPTIEESYRVGGVDVDGCFWDVEIHDPPGTIFS